MAQHTGTCSMSDATRNNTVTEPADSLFGITSDGKS